MKPAKLSLQAFLMSCLVAGLVQSARGFLPSIETSLVLSLCVGIAAILIMGTNGFIGNGVQFASAYDIATFSFMACVFPAFVEHITQPSPTRRAIRYIMWFIVAVLFLVGVNISPFMSGGYDSDKNLTYWEFSCFHDVIKNERQASRVIVLVVFLLPILYSMIMVPLWLFGKRFPRLAENLPVC